MNNLQRLSANACMYKACEYDHAEFGNYLHGHLWIRLGLIHICKAAAIPVSSSL